MTDAGCVVGTLARNLPDLGFDLVHPFTINGSFDELFPLPRFGRAASLGVLIANSHALWRPFKTWCQQHSDLEHPLHAYTEQTLEAYRGEVRSEIYYAHRTDYHAHGKQTAVPIQKLGRHAGFAALGPAYLSVHPQHGPWIAYRAVLCFDLPPLAEGASTTARTEPCASCDAPCQRELQALLARSSSLDVVPRWKEWLAVRDTCPEGRASRYPNSQLRYHYGKERDALFEED